MIFNLFLSKVYPIINIFLKGIINDKLKKKEVRYEETIHISCNVCFRIDFS